MNTTDRAQTSSPASDLAASPASSAGVECTLDQMFDRLESAIEQLDQPAEPAATTRQGVAILVCQAEMERLRLGLQLACDAARRDEDAVVFFAYWGLQALRRRTVSEGKTMLQRLLSWRMAGTPSRIRWGTRLAWGTGNRMMGRLARQQRMPSLGEELARARQLGVRFIACDASMHLMGLRPEELLEGVEIGDTATFLDLALRAKVSLFA